MSGLEAAVAVGGLISLTIAVIDASIQIYNAVKDKSGIPEKLRKVSDTLPSLSELLKGAQAQFDKDQPTKQAWFEVEKDLKRCLEACQKLHDIIERAYPKTDTRTFSRVFKNVGTLLSRKSETAEQLLKEIRGYLEILQQRQIIMNAALLDDIKQAVDELFPRPGLTQSNVSGTNIGGDQVFHNSNTGSGQQFNGPGGTFTFSNTPNELNEEFVRMRLQEWLRFPSIDDRRAAITKAHQDTFRWILLPAPSTHNTKHPKSNFIKWLRSGTGVYWIQGQMGCGKSTLMKYVTEQELTKKHLREWANGRTLHCPSYYFSKKGTSELQQSLQWLYRTLLATLIRHEKGLFRVAFPDWQASDFPHKPTSAVLRDALEKILTNSDVTCKYCFFIDGLDEYQETDSGLKGKLAEDILRLARLSAVKFVVASRPEPIFQVKFARCLTMKLHNLTRNDIAAYVDAEIRRKTLPHVLTAIDTRQLKTLCDEVIQKAEGVFLWVTIAVASILTGIADYETLPELRSRLVQLDPKLSVLFKQVLTERIQASHRKQVARCLLAAIRYDYICPHNPTHSTETQAVVQATSPYADASHDYTTLLGNGNEIEARVVGLQRSLPGRSCGLYLELAWATESPLRHTSLNSLRPLELSHSSLNGFLEEHETQAILLKEAGDDFQVNEAIAVGRMADLVLRFEIDPTPKERYGTLNLLDILLSIEMADISTGVRRTSLISTFDDTLCRVSKQSQRLAFILKMEWEWDPLYEDHIEAQGSTSLATLYSGVPFLGPQGISCHGSDLLSLSIAFGLTCYLEYKTNACRGLPPKIGTPLLFYPLWTRGNFLVWWRETSLFGIDDEMCHATLVKLLLAQGADPNECCHGLTPWSVLLQRICSGRDVDVPPSSRWTAVSWPKESFERLRVALEVGKLMLDHGADPFYSMESPRYTISPQIFAELLRREHCSGYSLHNCHCVYARQLQPQLKELVDLVEERRYLKLHMRTDGELLLTGAWLVVVSAYILQICFT